jgi:hypothetical protein
MINAAAHIEPGFLGHQQHAAATWAIGASKIGRLKT